MSDIRLEREFNVSPARLFEVLSSNAEVVRWWGHDSWTMRDQQLDFTREGPWHSAMISDEGNLFKLCLLYTSPSPRDQRGSRMPSSA